MATNNSVLTERKPLSAVMAAAELPDDATPAETAVVEICTRISALMEAHVGLEGIGYSIADGNNSQKDTRHIGFAIAQLAKHIEGLAGDISDQMYTMLEALESKEVRV